VRTNRSPWLEAVDGTRAPCPLEGDAATDVAVVGAGIAGVATAFFVLRETARRVLLIERDRLARGATGHNAGQIASYFERPLYELVDSFGFERSIAAQRDIDGAWALLDELVAETGATVGVERFLGHMGMFSLNHLSVHLRNNLLRARGGLSTERCVISEEAEFLADLLPEYRDLYTLVPQARVQELLGTTDPRYRAVLSDWKGCVNAALLCEQVVDHLLAEHPARFRFVDHTPVERITLDPDGAEIAAGGRRVEAKRIVLCTNGFVDHVIENRAGDDIRSPLEHRVSGSVGYMAAIVEPVRCPPAAISYLMSPRIGHGQAYFYMTRRPHHADGREATLTCVGGPDIRLERRSDYDPGAPVPEAALAQLDGFLRPLLAPDHAEPLPFDFTWHGLMAYTPTQMRLIGPEPRNPVLLYNLGCNGVGLLPSIYGGRRVARILAGESLPPSLFDPS
jgi:glycine/D-amino acid oxidase-like deaminating enzyme